MKRRVIFQGLSICVVVWAVVFSAQGYFRQFRMTAESVEEAVEEADLADWSKRKGEPQGAVAVAREAKIREVAELISKLDFTESGRARQRQVADDFFWRLSPKEQALFVTLTVEVMLERWMASFEGMEKEDQEKFLQRGLREFEIDMKPADLAHITKLGEKMREEVGEKGFRPYLDSLTPEEKIELAPLMEIMNELMQRMRMPKWEGREKD